MEALPLQSLIAAYKSISDLEAKRLESVLRKSNALLSPLEDPLWTDFGAHRWLSSAREESYSDWLSWILEQIQKPELVLQLFLKKHEMVSSMNFQEPLVVNREYGISEADGTRRRTDLELLYGSHKAILVEVKKTKASEVNPAQLETQRKNRSGFSHYILLANGGERSTYAGGFSLMTWKELSIGFRCMVSQHVLTSKTVEAMILAFVGAVEQNLLSIPGNLAKRVAQRQVISSVLRERISQHLEPYINPIS